MSQAALKQEEKIELLILSGHGRYIPQSFAELYRESSNGWDEIDSDLLDVLMAGPDHEDY